MRRGRVAREDGEVEDVMALRARPAHDRIVGVAGRIIAITTIRDDFFS